MAVLSWLRENTRQVQSLKEQTRIGRSPSNEILLSDATISWFHARIVRSNGSWILEDGNSANGGFVNGERQSRSVLRDGEAAADSGR